MHSEIKIEDFEIYVSLGIHEWERVTLQKVILSLRIKYGVCGLKSCMACKVDYHSLCLMIKDLVAKRRFDLIEDLARYILDTVTSRYHCVFECSVSVFKSLATMGAAKVSCSVHCSKV